MLVDGRQDGIQPTKSLCHLSPKVHFKKWRNRTEAEPVNTGARFTWKMAINMEKDPS